MSKFPQVFPRVIAVRTERRSLSIAVTKKQRTQGGGGNIQAILLTRVRKNIHGTLRYSFPGQQQGYPNRPTPMPLFYQPLQS